MGGDQGQGLRVPAPVFQELAGQFHGIPGHAVDSGYVQYVDLGQHVVQAVAELMEQGGDFVVGQQRRLAIHRRREVTGQEGHRQLQLAAKVAPADPAVCHPGATAFALARKEVEVEPGQRLAVAADAIGRDIRVPGFHVGPGFNLHVEQSLGNSEQAGHYLVDREPGAQGFRRDIIALMTQLLAEVTDVPGLQVFYTIGVFGKRFQVSKFLLGHGFGLGRQLVQEIQNLVHAAGHLGGQGALGVIVETQQLRHGMAALENFRHHWRIVPGTGVRAHIGGTGDKGLIDLAAQVPVLAVGQYRIKAREIQRDDVAIKILLPRCLLGTVQCRFGDTRQLLHIGNVSEPVLGSIQHVIAEAVGQLRELH